MWRMYNRGDDRFKIQKAYICEMEYKLDSYWNMKEKKHVESLIGKNRWRKKGRKEEEKRVK